ncbi:MAG: hypothetical protein CME62_17375 [Halobacteriovoraceae bacterium]|nr:hypothetical protein [Halobacteriovoraceae bacterium]|tara:strand:- start:2729 stop:4648 length:1920 start_codon:yes stop_codon:yes gene_type:complete
MRQLILILLFSLSALAQNGDQCADGLVFSAQLNRCIMNQDTVEQKSDARNCEGLAGDAYKKCFEENVAEQVGELESEGKIEKETKPKSKLFLPAIVTLGTAYLVVLKKDKISGCGSISGYLMLGGGVATLLGEFLAKKKYKSKLKKLEKKYKERLADDSLKEGDNIERLNQNQIIAFDYQIDQERARASAHKARKTTYTLAFGLYTAATVAAIVEQFTIAGKNKTCNLSGKDKDAEVTQTDSSAEASPADPQATADAQTQDPQPAEEGALQDGAASEEIQTAANASRNIVERGFRTPFVRAALSGVLALYSKKVADKAGKHAKEAEERAEAIEELKANYLATGGAGFAYCSEADRRSPTNAKCYCYTESGSKNMARENSATCQRVWNTNQNATPVELSKGLATTDEPTTGCLNSNGSFNSNCDCKVKKCTTFNGSLNLGPLASVDGTKSMMDNAEGLSSGRLSAGDINEAGIARMAASMAKQKDKWAKDPKTAETMKKIKDLELEMGKGFRNAIATAAKPGGALASLPPNSSFGSALIEDPKKENELANILGLPSKNSKKEKSNINRGSIKKENGLDFDFGSSPGGGVAMEDDTRDIMNKDFKVDSIHESDQGNIFKIIHNRYQTSGIKRLFSGELEKN